MGVTENTTLYRADYKCKGQHDDSAQCTGAKLGFGFTTLTCQSIKIKKKSSGYENGVVTLLFRKFLQHVKKTFPSLHTLLSIFVSWVGGFSLSFLNLLG